MTNEELEQELHNARKALESCTDGLRRISVSYQSPDRDSDLRVVIDYVNSALLRLDEGSEELWNAIFTQEG